MKDNTGFFIVLMLVLLVGVFFGADFPLTGSKTEKSANNKGESRAQEERQLTESEIQQKIRDAQRRVEELQEEIKEAKENEGRSQYYEKVYFAGLYSPSNRNIDEEYVTLRTSYGLENPIDITGWTIKSRSTGRTATIPKGTNLFLPNNGYYSTNIEVGKNQYIYINTGSSPISESFRVNICSGYHNQFYNFKPYIQETCPYPIDDADSIPYSFENEPCLDYIEDMNRCEVQTESLPGFSSQCTEYINQKVNYPTCVSNHKNDEDFYKDEWRIFLKGSQPLWRISREKLDLFDKEGKIVDSYGD